MPKCPTCKKIIITPLKEWTYAAFHVKFFKCRNCDKNFRAYYYKGKFSHIILPKHPSPRKRTALVRYLKTHDSATIEEIADSLCVPIEFVLKELIALEKLGVVGCYDEK